MSKTRYGGGTTLMIVHHWMRQNLRSSKPVESLFISEHARRHGIVLIQYKSSKDRLNDGINDFLWSFVGNPVRLRGMESAEFRLRIPLHDVEMITTGWVRMKYLLWRVEYYNGAKPGRRPSSKNTSMKATDEFRQTYKADNWTQHRTRKWHSFERPNGPSSSRTISSSKVFERDCLHKQVHNEGNYSSIITSLSFRSGLNKA